MLAEMKPVILVKLDKIFAPSFFDVMIHLAIHLPDEALRPRAIWVDVPYSKEVVYFEVLCEE